MGDLGRHTNRFTTPLDRGVTPSGVTLPVPARWRADLGLSAPGAPVIEAAPVPLDTFGLRTRRALHIVMRAQNGLPIDRVAAALAPDQIAPGTLRNTLNKLTERALLVNTAPHGGFGHWRATPLGRASVEADLQRGLRPRDVIEAVRALTDRAHPPALSRWWPVADDRQLAPPATVAAVMAFLFALGHPIASAPDLPARIESALESLVRAGTLIALAAPRGKHLTRCYWPATQEETP